MAQNENRWRDEGREWRDDNRWRGEGRRLGGDDRDDYGSGDRWAGGRGGPDWQGGREVYRGYVGNESGGFGHDSQGRDTARESERVYGRTFGGGRDDSRSGYGGYGSGYGGYGTSSGGGFSGAGRESHDYRDRDYGDRGDADYSRGYGAGYGERDLGRSHGQGSYGARDYGRDSSGDVSRGYGGQAQGRGYDPRHNEQRYDTRRGRVEERGFWEQAGDEIASWFGDDDAERRRHQDEARAAQNRGRGPRGYTRSDDRVREDINDRLTDDPYIDASEIEVSVDKGEVTLSGTVTHRNAKRRAEDIAEAISGVTHVQNNLRVRQATGPQTGQTPGSGTSTGAGASAIAGVSNLQSGTAGTAGTASPAGTAAGVRRT